jgi:FkbM family methyltransferase
MRLLKDLLRRGETVWDVGAHHGFVTLCAAKRVGPTGVVHAFEPSASNQAALRRHLRWNRLTNVEVHPYALSDSDGESCFGSNATSKMCALGHQGETVAVRRGTTIAREGISAPPTFLKIDVEGAEAAAIAGTLPILSGKTRMLVAIHGPEADEKCTRLLEAADYQLVPSRALQACRTGRWRADPDMFCIGPDSDSRDEDLSLLRAAGF